MRLVTGWEEDGPCGCIDKRLLGCSGSRPRFSSPQQAPDPLCCALNVSLCWEVARDKGCMSCRHKLVPWGKRLLTCAVEKAA